MRVVSIGLSRRFRLVEVDGPLYRVEQAVQSPLTTKWEWRPLATTPNWGEGHGALHQMQDDWWEKYQRVKTTGARS